MAQNPRPPIDRFRAHVAPSAGVAFNTVRHVHTVRWIGVMPSEAEGLFVLARDVQGVETRLSRVLPPGAVVDIDLRSLDPESRHELGIAVEGGSSQTEYVGPRLRFRLDELLRAAAQIRENTPEDEGSLWLQSLEIIEPPPHDEQADHVVA